MIRVVGDQSKMPLPTVDWDGHAPEELVQALAMGSPFRMNMEWFDAHAEAIFQQYPDLYYCVAGQELFVGTTRQEALVAARAKHPAEAKWVYTPILPRRRR